MIQLFSLLLLAFNGWALDFKAGASFRNLPSGKTIEVEARDEFLLWDQRTDKSTWKMGFIQPRILVGAHGAAEVGINLVPVGPLEIGYTKGVTHRFYDNSAFDCSVNLCKGVIDREKVQVRLGLAFGDFFAIPSYAVIKTRSEDKSKPLLDHEEALLTVAGGDDLEAVTLMTGIKTDNELKTESEAYGIYLRQSEYKNSNVWAQSQYVFFRKEFKPWAAAAGVGRFDSSFSKPGFSIYVNVEWLWGHSLALF